MVEPLCEYFGICGGCSSQHIPYETQLLNKKKQLAQAINVDLNSIEVFSDKEYFYRNRMDLLFTFGGVGCRRKDDSKSCIKINKCVIIDEKINSLIQELNKNFKDVDFFNLKKNSGTFRGAVVRTSGNITSISFVLNEDSTKLSDAVEKIKEYAKINTAENIIITYVSKDIDESISNEFFVVKGTDVLVETYLGHEFIYSVQGFFQNNTAMASKMHQYVNKLCDDEGNKKLSLLDLYAGVGTFGINNCEFFKNLFIVEADTNCINSAKINIEKNKISNAKIVELDAMQLKKINLPEKDLFIITDPPRCGMHMKTIEEINKLEPKKIIYISCNITQLGKELTKFKKYKLKNTAMFDLFPHTNHVEAIVELVLK